MLKDIFTDLLDFRPRRTGKQAVGFFLFFAMVYLCVSGIYGALFFRSPDVDGAMRLANDDRGLKVLLVLMSVGLALLVLNKKAIHRKPVYLLHVLGAGLLSAFGGIFGLIPVAYLTTRNPE